MSKNKSVVITVGPPVAATWDSGKEVEQWADWPVVCDGAGVSREPRKIEHALSGPFKDCWYHEWSMGHDTDSIDACLADYRTHWEQHGWTVEFIVRP